MSDPVIVPRSGWGANPLNTPAGYINTPTPELWLHHTGSSGLHGVSGMQSLQRNAIAGGYVDLEYTYMVDTDGTTYMSRGPGRDSAATMDHNSVSHAICVMGNFENDAATDTIINAVADLVAYMHRNGWTRNNAITGPHSDVYATACCGRNLKARIGDINYRAAHGTTNPPKPPKPIPVEDEMFVMTCAGRPARLFTGVQGIGLHDQASVNALNAAGVKTAQLTATDYDNIMSSLSSLYGTWD